MFTNTNFFEIACKTGFCNKSELKLSGSLRSTTRPAATQNGTEYCACIMSWGCYCDGDHFLEAYTVIFKYQRSKAYEFSAIPMSPSAAHVLLCGLETS